MSVATHRTAPFLQFRDEVIDEPRRNRAAQRHGIPLGSDPEPPDDLDQRRLLFLRCNAHRGEQAFENVLNEGSRLCITRHRGRSEFELVAALGDFLGALLFPIGTYFPGFTLTAFLTGCVYGFFLYKEQNWPRIIAAVGINQLILSLFLNTLWISILYGSPYGPLLATRLVQCLILTAVQLIGIPLIAKGLSHTVRKDRTS